VIGKVLQNPLDGVLRLFVWLVKYCRMLLRWCIAPVCVTGEVLQNALEMMHCACLCDRRSVAESSWDYVLLLFVWQAKYCRIVLGWHVTWSCWLTVRTAWLAVSWSSCGFISR